jgi:alkylation response protein AidB-like acyl-CoA dehydrogenase
MQTIQHPSSLLKPEWVNIIRNHAATAEQLGYLTPEQIDLIHSQDWFKMLVPGVYGGKEMQLPDVVKLEESLAWADGSVGWVITLCAGAGWFGGFLSEEFAKETYKEPAVCICGSGAASGTAEILENGYLVNGKWLHASGAPHATIFTTNCIITKNKQAIKDAAGNDVVLSFAFLRDEVSIIPEWNAIGMVATASYKFELRDVFVTVSRSFKIDATAVKVATPLYTYPFLQLAEATLAANLSGMAIHFLDLCEDLYSVKTKKDKTLLIDDPLVFAALLRAKEDLADARAKMYHALQHSWDCHGKDTLSAAESLHAVSITSKVLAKTVRTVVDELYPYCGLRAADPRTEINRVWRDLHTASQHALLLY